MNVKYAIILCLIITSYQTGKTIGSENPRIPNIYRDDQVIEDLWGFVEVINSEETREINRGYGFTNFLFLEAIIPEQYHIRLRNWFNDNRNRLGRGGKLYKSDFNEMIRILMDAEARRALLRALRMNPNVHNREQVIEDLWGFVEVINSEETREINRGYGFTNFLFLEAIIPEQYHIRLRNWFNDNRNRLGRGGKLYKSDFNEMIRILMDAEARRALLRALRMNPNVHNREQVLEDLWGFAEIKDTSEPFEIDWGNGYTNLTFLETIIPPTYHIELRNWFSANGHLLGEDGQLYPAEFREMMKTIMTAGSRLILLNALRD